MNKVEASVARCLRAPPETAKPQDFDFGTITALRGNGHRSIVVIGNYKFDPITAVSCRAKDHPLHPRRSYFAPAEIRRSQTGRGGVAGYRPRVRKAYFDAVYRHSRKERGETNTSIGAVFTKGNAATQN